jgi:monoamine oxidase
MSKQVIIIGGGLSGLTLAYLLEKKGFDPTLIEASYRLGGRIQTVNGKLNTPLELGATWFTDQHHQLMGLLQELGLNKYPQFTKGTSFFQTNVFEPPQIFSIPESEAPSYRIAGGTQTLINTLRSKLSRTKIILNTQITQVSLQKNNTLLVEAGNKSFHCDKVIVCLPPQLASSIEFAKGLPSELKAFFPTVQTWMAGSIKFVLEYERPFWRDKGLSGILYSHADIVSEMYDHTNYQENKFGFTGFLNSETAGSSQEERRSNVLRHLSGLLGNDALNPTAYFDKVWNDSFLVHENLKHMRPHQNNGHPYLQDAYLGGNFFFCGTETASEFSGYMEGAIQSAKRVASLLN